METRHPTHPVADEHVLAAYLYLLGRLLVLRQQHLDFDQEHMAWNVLRHREPGGVQWANPSLDFVYSEAWVALPEQGFVVLELPRIEGRYYTWHMLNGWGETVLNINERTFAQQPFGRYALCRQAAPSTHRPMRFASSCPCSAARVLARIEIGRDLDEAVGLQRQMRLEAHGRPAAESLLQIPSFANQALPGAWAFDFADAVLRGEPDINPGMEPVRAQLGATAAWLRDEDAARERIDAIIRDLAWPALWRQLRRIGPVMNGWARPAAFGNYGSDFRTRTLINLAGIWGNNANEACYFGRMGLDGSATHLLTFAADELPHAQARYFWSVIAVDAKRNRVLPNLLARHVLSSHSPLQPNEDGSLTLAFGPRQPLGVPESNWLPTPPGETYNLTFRFYGPTPEVSGGQYFPPELAAQTT